MFSVLFTTSIKDTLQEAKTNALLDLLQALFPGELGDFQRTLWSCGQSYLADVLFQRSRSDFAFSVHLGGEAVVQAGC